MTKILGETVEVVIEENVEIAVDEPDIVEWIVEGWISLEKVMAEFSGEVLLELYDALTPEEVSNLAGEMEALAKVLRNGADANEAAAE